jgi:hypothetical protein
MENLTLSALYIEVRKSTGNMTCEQAAHEGTNKTRAMLNVGTFKAWFHRRLDVQSSMTTVQCAVYQTRPNEIPVKVSH